MPDLFDETPVDEFALPGDDALIRKIAVVEPAPAEPEAYVEPDGETTPVERVRDESGRFAKAEPATDETPAEEPAAAEPEPATAIARTDEEIALDNILGKFGVDPAAATPAELKLAQSYREVERTKGEQAREIGDLRRAFEERFSQLDQRLATPAQPQQQITQELVDTNPGYATALAFEQGNQGALAVAYEAWKIDDPAAAGAWLGAKQAEEAFNQRFAAQQEQISQLEAKLVPAAAATADQQRAALVSAAAVQHPGLADFVASDAINKLAAEIPDFGQMLASGAPDQQVRAITYLYEIHRGRESDNLKVTQQEVARTTALEAQQAREDAFVASSTMAATGTKPSRADEIAAEWDAMRSPFDAGWNV